MKSKDLEQLDVVSIFSDSKYVVPIYQRNYAWNEEQIVQLIEDVSDNKLVDYFLGNLIVNEIDRGVYEVIDGQQRLTTLFLLETYLGLSVPTDALRFEAREKSNRTLKNLSTSLNGEFYSTEILNGYHIIDNYFEKNKGEAFKQDFVKKLKRVRLVRVQVPQGIDLNHYFEIMNTRGEQLELHEVAKARFLQDLGSKERVVANHIWTACSDMSSYVQMNFDKSIRDKIFGSNWSELKAESFDDLLGYFGEEELQDENRRSLKDILKNEKFAETTTNKIEEEENTRFESILSFPNFLLQVGKIINSSNSLDDKNFLGSLKGYWEKDKTAKIFLFNLLKYRVLFDKYILKREFKGDYKETGRWSLQRLKKSTSTDETTYRRTFKNTDENAQLRTLQSCLRVTYTSPRTMEWVSYFLSELPKEPSVEGCIELLEKYCRDRVGTDYEKTGFAIPRIVFTYLDYLIYRDGYKDIISKRPHWEFQFRNSIEHFYPQHPTVEHKQWQRECLDSFGNLALVTVSGNSKFSNLVPSAKISQYKNVVEQSLKLKVMANIAETDWTEELAGEHGNKMIEILEKDLSKLRGSSAEEE